MGERHGLRVAEDDDVSVKDRPRDRLRGPAPRGAPKEVNHGEYPVQPNSAIWTMSIAAVEPDLMFAASRYGYLYRSDDGGDSWRKLWRELGEVSSVLWVPQ